MKFIQLIFILITTPFVIIPCSSKSNTETTTEEIFQFIRNDPGNALGIFPTVMTIIERPAKKTTDFWRINRNSIPKEHLSGFKKTCEQNNNCKFSPHEITFSKTHGIPEEKNITIIYFQVDFQPHTKQSDVGEKFCHFDMVDETKIYFVMKTFSELPKNDTTIPKTVVESVATVHQHQLAEFPEDAMDMLDVDQDAVYQFSMEDYYDRDELYECLLAVGNGASVEVLNAKCHFQCVRVVKEGDPQYEKAKKAAKNGEKIVLQSDVDAVEEDEDEGHDEL